MKLLLKYWPWLAGAVAVAALFILWQSDRNSQYKLGVADQKAAYEQLVRESKELTDNEKNIARDLASDAARRVCIDAGVDTRECEGL